MGLFAGLPECWSWNDNLEPVGRRVSDWKIFGGLARGIKAWTKRIRMAQRQMAAGRKNKQSKTPCRCRKAVRGNTCVVGYCVDNQKSECYYYHIGSHKKRTTHRKFQSTRSCSKTYT